MTFRFLEWKSSCPVNLAVSYRKYSRNCRIVVKDYSVIGMVQSSSSQKILFQARNIKCLGCNRLDGICHILNIICLETNMSSIYVHALSCQIDFHLLFFHMTHIDS